LPWKTRNSVQILSRNQDFQITESKLSLVLVGLLAFELQNNCRVRIALGRMGSE
jgi:hypothetical protein